MPQFDVHRNVGAQRSVIPYVVIVQSRRFDAATRRVVVPLVLASAAPTADPRLNPAFDVEGVRVVLNPLHLASMAVERMGELVTSLNDDGDRVIAAIDLLLSRAWD